LYFYTEPRFHVKAYLGIWSRAAGRPNQKSNREDAKTAKKTTKTPRHKESRNRDRGRKSRETPHF
jgi:hypothetical protein